MGRTWRFMGSSALLLLAAVFPSLQVWPAGAQSPRSGGTTSLTVLPGGLTLTLDDPARSGLPPIEAPPSRSQQVYYLPITSYTATDATGTGDGWHIRFQATPLTSSDGSTLPTDSLLMAPPTVSCRAKVTCSGRAAPPDVIGPGPFAIDGPAPVTVASAAINSGMGSYRFTPGSLDGNPGHNVEVIVSPSDRTRTYSSVLTITIATGP